MPPPNGRPWPQRLFRTIRQGFFATPLNGIVSLVVAYVAWRIGSAAFEWAVLNATWDAADRSGCPPGGACWAFVLRRLPQFIFGFYPEQERWRAEVVLLAPPILFLIALLPRFPGQRPVFALGLAIFPVFALAVLDGGPLGLPVVATDRWGGLLLTVVVGVSAFVISLPLGVALALARTSDLPALRLLATGFIEFWRGLPLVAILFMAVIMLPLFLPPGMRSTRLSLALVAITLYSASYLAEVVRGGLESVGRGQIEASSALAFGYWTTQRHIVMPQALRAVLPGIVNSAIALFKDTTYVMVVGLFDLLNIVTAGLSDPRWLGLAAEGYVFVGVIFWVTCFGMSRISSRLERRALSAPATSRPPQLAEERK